MQIKFNSMTCWFEIMTKTYVHRQWIQVKMSFLNNFLVWSCQKFYLIAWQVFNERQAM